MLPVEPLTLHSAALMLACAIIYCLAFAYYTQSRLLDACLPDNGPYATLLKPKRLTNGKDLALRHFVEARPHVVTRVRSWRNPFCQPVVRRCVPVVSIIGNICAGKSELMAAMEKATGWPLIRESIADWKNDRGHDWFEQYNLNRQTYALPFQMKIVQTQAQSYATVQCDLASGKLPMKQAVLSERGPMDALIVFADVNARDEVTSPKPAKTPKESHIGIRGISGCAEIQLLADLVYQTGAGWAPSVALFVDVDPDTCMQRKIKRARRGEENISIEYLRSLDARYRQYADLLRGSGSGVVVLKVENSGASLDTFLHTDNVERIVAQVRSALQTLK